MRNILAILSVLFVLASCCSNQGKQLATQEQIDYLEQRIDELEEKNAAQESRISDLEADLENVISFLNDELNY